MWLMMLLVVSLRSLFAVSGVTPERTGVEHSVRIVRTPPVLRSASRRYSSQFQRHTNLLRSLRSGRSGFSVTLSVPAGQAERSTLSQKIARSLVGPVIRRLRLLEGKLVRQP